MRRICIFALFLITVIRKKLQNYDKFFVVLDYCTEVSLIEMISIESGGQTELSSGYPLNFSNYIVLCIFGDNAEKEILLNFIILQIKFLVCSLRVYY